MGRLADEARQERALEGYLRGTSRACRQYYSTKLRGIVAETPTYESLFDCATLAYSHMGRRVYSILGLWPAVRVSGLGPAWLSGETCAVRWDHVLPPQDLFC